METNKLAEQTTNTPVAATEGKVWTYTKMTGKVLGGVAVIAGVAFGAFKLFQHFGGDVVVTLPDAADTVMA